VGKEDDKVIGKRPTSNVTLSGVSEFDYLGDESNEKEKTDEPDQAKEKSEQNDDEVEDFDPTRKSLEKDFE